MYMTLKVKVKNGYTLYLILLYDLEAYFYFSQLGHKDTFWHLYMVVHAEVTELCWKNRSISVGQQHFVHSDIDHQKHTLLLN